MAAALGGAVVTQWPLGWLSDRFDRRVVIVAIAAGSAAVSSALALAAWPFGALLPLAATFGAMTLPIYSLCVAHVNDRASADLAVAVAGGLILLYGAAAAAGPLAAGLVMEALGSRGLFVTTGSAMAAVAIFGVVNLVRREAVEMGKKTAYAEALRTTHVVGDLDPRDPSNRDE